MTISPLLVSLEKALRCLPGVGPRSASRMALHLLERDRERGLHLAATLTRALEQIEHCEKCQNLTEIQPLSDLSGRYTRSAIALYRLLAKRYFSDRTVRLVSGPVSLFVRALEPS